MQCCLAGRVKKNVVNLERGHKKATTQTALAIECLLRRESKFRDFEMLNELHEDVKKKQTELVISAIKENPALTIEITDNICALDFKKYAKDEIWNGKGTEFEINFDDANAVQVSKEDFIKYQFQYTDFAIELEEKYSEYINELRDYQRDAAEELLKI